MNAQKIAVVGIGGSGKSVFARKLAEQTGLPLFHMDALFWKGNWQAVPEAEYIEAQRKLLAENDHWIIEGYVDEVLADRLRDADLIIYLDYSGFRCFWRIIRRWLKHRRESRPELPKKALEKLNWKFFRVVLTRGERPGIEKALSSVERSKIIRLKSPHDTDMLKLN
jgi:adenylate kinase family enzyme